MQKYKPSMEAFPPILFSPLLLPFQVSVQPHLCVYRRGAKAPPRQSPAASVSWTADISSLA